jgi:uncharacterized damage-inducible protein DinB
MASERATAFADDLAAANAEAISFVQACSDEAWAVVVPGEEWTVGVVLHHIAEGHALGLSWIGSMSKGEPVTETQASIDAKNMEHAARAVGVSQADTLALLRENGDRLEALLRGLRDDELDRTASFGPAGGREFPVEAMASVSAGHLRGHLEHAREAVASS